MGVRRAETGELQYSGESLSLRDDFTDILARGHVIHGYASGGGLRMLMVLGSRDYSDSAPLLGFGTGHNVEIALRRTRDTYRRREAEGLDFITEKQYPESLSGLLTAGASASVLDRIVLASDIKIFQDDEEIVAWTSYDKSGRNRTPVEARGADAQSAVDALSEVWLAS